MKQTFITTFFIVLHSFSFAQIDMVEVKRGVQTLGKTPDQGVVNSNSITPYIAEVWDFRIAKYELMQELYEAVMGDNPSVVQGQDSLPIMNVDMIAYLVFCNELTIHEGLDSSERVYYKDSLYTIPYTIADYQGDGIAFIPNDSISIAVHMDPIYQDHSRLGFRLPTNAEWEYAARGGHLYPEQTKYPGSDDPFEVAWFNENNMNQLLFPVGRLKPNALGIYDLSGNVGEPTAYSRYNYTPFPQCNPTRFYSENRDNPFPVIIVDRSGALGEDSLSTPISMKFVRPMWSRFNQHGLRVVQSVGDTRICSLDTEVSLPICHDNDTPFDPSDDTYTFDLEVNRFDGMVVWTADDPNQTKGPYYVPVEMGPYAISDGLLEFTIIDSVSTGFQQPISITPPPTCSDSCIIQIDSILLFCNDNGTSLDIEDDLVTVAINLSGINTSSSWTASQLTAIGVYDSLVTLGRYERSDIPSVVTIKDNLNRCSVDLGIDFEQYCITDCSITAELENIICNDNDTPFNPNDDSFTASIVVEGFNTGQGWKIEDNSSNDLTYGALELIGPFNNLEDIFSVSIIDNSENCQVDLDLDGTSCINDSAKARGPIIIPNVFAPNASSDLNKAWTFNIPYPYISCDVKVFSRWGELVHEQKETEIIFWDGKFNGNDAAPGTYIYYIRYVGPNGIIYKNTGDVTLIR